MALISCPECGKEVSDKVKACPNCGYPFAAENPSDVPQPVAVTSVKLVSDDPKKKKKLLLFFIGAVIICFAVIAGISVSQRNQATKYVENIALARSLMLEGGIQAEELGNLTKAVWYNTIYEKLDSETNPYTINDYGNHHSDFNNSLGNLYAAPETQEKVDSIEANIAVVDSVIADLQNPPKEFLSCYETLDKMYDSYKALTSLAIAPTGSLTSYSEDFRTLDTEFVQHYQKLGTILPE